MSRVAAPGGRPVFASKIAYDALQVESGEESEEEIQEEAPESRFVCRVIDPLFNVLIIFSAMQRNRRSLPSLLSKRQPALLVLSGNSSKRRRLEPKPGRPKELRPLLHRQL